MAIDIESSIARVQNKVKRSMRWVWVYYVNQKFLATTSPDEKLIKHLVGVYDGRADTYDDQYVDDDLRWMAGAA